VDDVEDVILPVPRPASFENIPRCTPIIKLPISPPYADSHLKADSIIDLRIPGIKSIFLIPTKRAIPIYIKVINGTSFSEKEAILFKPPKTMKETNKTRTIPIINLGTVTISKKDSNVIISIKDYAGGLSKEVSDKLFKEMVTTKGKNGTGLGLFMSYSNIRAHFNGNITVKSKPGVGSEFKIILPVYN